VQPAVRLSDQVVPFLRLDHLDPGQALGDRRELVVGVNFLPTPLIRVRASCSFEDRASPQPATSRVYRLSVTLSF